MSRFSRGVTRDSYQPRYNDGRQRESRGARSDEMYHFGGARRGPQGRGDFSFRPRIAERDLLTHFPSSVETTVLASNHTRDKFRDVDNLTDSEEEAMDEGISEEEEYGRVKRRKLNGVDTSAGSKPRWSNPDPYTALPPPPDLTGKHVDVLKMIRKARAEPLGQRDNAAQQDDFISFDNFDDALTAPPPDAPSGPKAALFDGAEPFVGAKHQNLGKRKREESEPDALIRNGRGEYHANGAILSAWRVAQDFSPTPWLQIASSTDSPMVALHKELLDFYSWVRPHDYEFAVREDLVDRLGNDLKRYKPGQLKAFGSYAAGLYLPTGDMDLVYTTRGRITKNDMYEISRLISRSRLARSGSTQVIAFAKVPIVKFVDDLTGLKVDLSFNNTTGVVAIETFRKWQVAYPSMPIIVAFIKQFLMIRGLNDNAAGGLGGFATICLVTSLIQNLPASKHQNLGEVLVEFFNLYGNLIDFSSIGLRLDPPGFIDKFTYPLLPNEKRERLMIIDPNRPDNNITGGSSLVPHIFDLFSRTHETLVARLDEFANPDTRNTSHTFFADLVGGNFTAYHEQRQILHSVYSQRYPGSGIPPPPPPPSVVFAQPPPPPPPHSSSTRGRNPRNGPSDDESATELSTIANDISTSTKPAKQIKSVRRLERIRSLCPELQQKLKRYKKLTVNEAVAVGGWKDPVSMDKDLSVRERDSQQKQTKGKKVGK